MIGARLRCTNRFRKPPAGTPLRADGHWSVNGLVGAWAFNEGSGTTITNAVTGGATTLGSGVAWSGDNLLFSGGANSSVPLGINCPSGALTAVMGFVTQIKPGNAANPVLFLYPNPIGSLSIPNTGANTPYFYMGGNCNRYWVSPANLLTAKSWVFTLPGNAQGDVTNSALYADGSLVGVSSTTDSGAQTSRGAMSIGYSTYTAQGTASYYLIYNRVLTAGEIASITANPWQIFQQY